MRIKFSYVYKRALRVLQKMKYNVQAKKKEIIALQTNKIDRQTSKVTNRL